MFRIAAYCTVFALFMVLPGCRTCEFCVDLADQMNRAVLMDYDHVATFERYQFAVPATLPAGGSVEGVDGYTLESGIRPSGTRGVWATFVICDLRNDGELGTPFRFDVNKFFVEYGGVRHYYRPFMTPGTFWSLDGSRIRESDSPPVAQRFRLETQLGPDTSRFERTFFPAVHYRLAILITVPPGDRLAADGEYKLSYDAPAVLLTPRGHDPVVHRRSSEPARARDLPSTCRPPAR